MTMFIDLVSTLTITENVLENGHYNTTSTDQGWPILCWHKIRIPRQQHRFFIDFLHIFVIKLQEDCCSFLPLHVEDTDPRCVCLHNRKQVLSDVILHHNHRHLVIRFTVQANRCFPQQQILSCKASSYSQMGKRVKIICWRCWMHRVRGADSAASTD